MAIQLHPAVKACFPSYRKTESRRSQLLKRSVLVFAVMAPFTNIPQIAKIYSEQAANLSLSSWLLYMLFNIPLIAYGIADQDKVILFNASLNLTMQCAVVFGILLYSL